MILIRHVTALAAALLLGVTAPLAAQQSPAKRLSSIVSVAVAEYALGIDEQGRLISELEYTEAVDFLADARGVAERISGARADEARAVLDTIIAAVAAKRPPSEVATLHERFNGALGSDAALDMPAEPIDLAEGRALYEAKCASCHGMSGGGDGPAGAGMEPAPPPIGRLEAMLDVSPALAYNVVSVGIKGTAMTGFGDELTVEQRWNIVSYLDALRHSEASRAEGEGLFLQRCAGCHGLAGESDGVLNAALSKLPPEIGSFAWQATRTDGQLAEVIHEGMRASAMPPSRDLSGEEVLKIVAYVRALPVREGAPAPALALAAQTPEGDAAAKQVIFLLDQALSAARGGRLDEANDRAFDSYIAFEPLESRARARSPGLVTAMERYFAEFKGHLRARDLRAAERSRNAIEAGMPAVLEFTRKPEGRWGAFVASFLIIFREGLEAILVVGAIVAFLIKTGHRERLRAIWLGCAAAIAASAVMAVVLKTVLAALPASREIIEGATMLVAVAVLFSVSYWLISKVEAAKWQQFIREKVTAALEHGGGRALALVAFLAVFREGAETALFYQALIQDGASLGVPIALGIVAGTLVLAVIFVLFYRFGVRIPLRPFFAATSVLLYYMAFVFAGKGIRELQEGNVVPITIIPGFPNIEVLGIFPSVETLLAQFVLLALFVFALLKTFWPKRSVALPSVEPVRASAPDLVGRVAELQAEADSLRERVAALERMLAETPAPRTEVEAVR
ncbi:MAG TPA: FTR1 family protein [Gemmatimonadaceae bacterium]